jgi:hypothetical protein
LHGTATRELYNITCNFLLHLQTERFECDETRKGMLQALGLWASAAETAARVDRGGHERK